MPKPASSYSDEQITARGRQALSEYAPYSMRRKVDPNDLRFVQGKVGSGHRYASNAQNDYAGVEEGDPNVIHVEDVDAFMNPTNTPQLALHEYTHIFQNRLHPSVQAKLPPIRESDPYALPSEQELAAGAKAGANSLQLSREQQAALAQQYAALLTGYRQARARGKVPPEMARQFSRAKQVYEPYLNHLASQPLTVLQPTAPNDSAINLRPNDPGLPAAGVAGMESFEKASALMPVSGNYTADDVEWVKPGENPASGAKPPSYGAEDVEWVAPKGPGGIDMSKVSGALPGMGQPAAPPALAPISRGQALTGHSLSAPVPATPKEPATPTVSAAQPTQGQAIQRTLANSAVGRSLQSTMPRVASALGLEPTATESNPDAARDAGQLLAPEYLAQGIGRRTPAAPASTAENVTTGALKGLGGMTTPGMLTTMAAPVGEIAGAIGPVAARLVPRLLSAGFTLSAIQGLYDSAPAYREAVARGDKGAAQEIAGGMIVDAAMAALAGRHAMGEPIGHANRGEVLPPEAKPPVASMGAPEPATVEGHPAGKVTGIDQKTGLPIVDRESAARAEGAAPAPGVEDVPRGKGAESAPLGTEAESGRPVLQGSAKAEELRQEAERKADAFRGALEEAAEGVPGARVEAVREAKDAERVAEKAQSGKPVETQPDHLAGRIVAETPQAKEQVAANLAAGGELGREDNFTGSGGTNGFRADTHQVTVGGPGEALRSAEAQILTPEQHAASEATHDLYERQRTAEAQGDQATADRLGGQIRTINDAAARAAEQRQKGLDSEQRREVPAVNALATQEAAQRLAGEPGRAERTGTEIGRIEDAAGKGKTIPGAEGSATSLLTPTRQIPARYRLVEADSLQPSHDARTFARNPRYPEGVQERAYDTSKEAQSRVIQQAQNYDPRYTVNTNPDAVNGPPVVTPSGIVLGGNSRAMSTQRLYSGEGGERYKQELARQADSFGLKPEQVQAMRQPVLVREVPEPATHEEARRLGAELNKSMTGALGVSERAVSAGKNIRPETLREVSDLMQRDDSTLREMMARHGGELTRMLVRDGAITERERPQFIDAATGGLSEEGKTFVERALLGSALDDPRLMDAAPKSILLKLERSLGAIASFGSRADEWNVLPALRAAVAEHASIQQSGGTVETRLGQTSMFGGERNPVVDALVRALDRKPNEVRAALQEFARDSDANQPGQTRMFGGGLAFEAFNHAFGSRLSEKEYAHGLEEAATSAPSPAPEHAAPATRDEGLPTVASGEQAPGREAGGAGVRNQHLQSSQRSAEGAKLEGAGGDTSDAVPRGIAAGAPVVVRDPRTSAEHPGVIAHFNPGTNGGPRRARVALTDGRTMDSVAEKDLRPIQAPKVNPESRWIGVDLDKTLAQFHQFEGATRIGSPIPKMVDRVKRWLAEGKDVRILTARVSDGPESVKARAAIEAWTAAHLGRALPVTDVKDDKMALLYDDRAVHVEPNRGEIARDEDHRAAGVAGGKPEAEPKTQDFREELKRASQSTLRENAIVQRSQVSEFHGRKMVVLDADGMALWHRALKRLGAQVGAGVSWRGMTLDKGALNRALVVLEAHANTAATQPGGAAMAEGFRRMARSLEDARNRMGGATLLRGDHRADTSHEEAVHLWQMETGLARSAAMREVAERPEFVETARRLREMGYDGRGSDRNELANEMMAKALANDPDLHATEEQRYDLAHAFLSRAVEDEGPEVLRGLPETADPAVQAAIREARRTYGDHGGQDEGGARQEDGGELRAGDGQGARRRGEDHPGPRGQRAARDLQPGAQRASEEEGELGPQYQKRLPGERPLPGMERAVEEQDEAGAARRGEELTEELRRAKGDISRKAGEMERESPLFRDTDANPQGRLFQRHADEDHPVWYLKSEKLIAEKMRGPMSGDALLSMLRNNGVKADELKWTALDDLQGKPKVTPEEARAKLAENNARLVEVTKDGNPLSAKEWQTYNALRTREREAPGTLTAEDWRKIEEIEDRAALPKGGGTKFSTYQLPGGENYREMLLTLPERGLGGISGDGPRDVRIANLEGELDRVQEAMQPLIDDPERSLPGWPHHAELDRLSAEHRRLTRALEEEHRRGGVGGVESLDFKSNHWDEPNVIAHVRFNDRTSSDGKKLVHLEEIQSDWHQKGRVKGYKPAVGGVVPDAPWKKDWHEMAFRRMVRYAAEHGYDGVSWTPGEQQAERYDLSKQIDRIGYTRHPDGTYTLSGEKNGESLFSKDRVPASQLPDFIGKDLARRIVEETPNVYDQHKGNITGELTGLDLKVGGEGMKGFYDKIIPDYANKFGKRWGARVGKTEIATEAGKTQAVPYLPVTPEMKESVTREGVPLFQREGAENATEKALEELTRRLAELPEEKLSAKEQVEESLGRSIEAMKKQASWAERALADFPGQIKKAWDLWKGLPEHSEYKQALGRKMLYETQVALRQIEFARQIRRVAPRDDDQIAITHYLQAGGDEKVLRQQAAETRAALTGWRERTAAEKAERERLKKAGTPKEKMAAALEDWRRAVQAGQGKGMPGNPRSYIRPLTDRSYHYELATRLTPEQKKLAMAIKQFNDDMLRVAQDEGVLHAGARNYVHQVYDKESAARLATAIATDELNPNPSFVRRRVFQSYFEAENAGMTPKDKRIGFLTSVTAQSMAQAISDRRLLRSLLEAPATPESAEKFYTVGGATNTGPKPFVLRAKGSDEVLGRYATEAEAWKAAEERKGSARRPVAAMRGTGHWVIANEHEAKQILQPMVSRSATDDYVSIDAPQLKNFLWAPTVEDLESLDPKLFEDDPKRLAFRGSIVIHPSYAGHVRALVEGSYFHSDKAIAKVGKAALTASTLAKESMVLASPFHQMFVSTAGLMVGVNPLTLPEINLDEPEQRELVMHGLNVLHVSPEGLFSVQHLSKLLGGVPVASEVLRRMENYSDYLFQDYLPKIKMQAARNMLGLNKKLYAKKFSPDQIAEMTAKQANNLFGGLNHKMNHLARHKTGNDLLRLFLFAPDFEEGNLRFAASALSPTGAVPLRALAGAALIMWTGARAMNMLLNHGDPHFDQPFGVVFHGRVYSLRSPITILLELFDDTRSFFYNRMNPMGLRPVVQLLTGRDKYGRQKTVGSTAGDVVKQVAPITVQKVLQTSDETWGDSILSAFGINASVYRTPTEEKVHRLYLERISASPEDPAHKDAGRKAYQMTEKLREHKMTTSELWKQVGEGHLSAAQARRIYDRAQMSELAYEYEHLKFADALKVYEKATLAEKLELRPILARKARAAVEGLPEPERGPMETKISSILLPAGAR